MNQKYRPHIGSMSRKKPSMTLNKCIRNSNSKTLHNKCQIWLWKSAL